MTTLDTTPLDAAKEAVQAKAGEVEAAERALGGLQAERRREALAERGTQQLRASIADAEADLEDLRTQETALQRTLEREEQVHLHRARQAALAEVYRRDVEYLKANKLAFEAHAEYERARQKVTRLTSCDWYDSQTVGRGHPLLYEDRTTDELPVKLAPLRTSTPPSPGKGPVENDIDFDIARLESLAQEAEGEASGIRSDEENGAGK